MHSKSPGLKPVPVAVDAKGIRVDHGVRAAPDAALAIVTPGQQAPTGVTLSPERRAALLAWAAREDAWVIEDDYLAELQLGGRAAPAMAADDPSGRVIHVGTFSKTISPTLGLGFVVAPLSLAARFGEVAGYLNPAPNVSTQLALAEFIGGGPFPAPPAPHEEPLPRAAQRPSRTDRQAYRGRGIRRPRGDRASAARAPTIWRLAKRAPDLGIAPCAAIDLECPARSRHSRGWSSA